MATRTDAESPRPRVSTQVRLPAPLHEALVERTTTNDLSLNETIVRMLFFALSRTGTPVTIVTTQEWTV